MKKEIKGKVLLVTVQAKEADVNLDNGKGFRLTAGSRKAFLKVRHTFIALKKGDEVTLSLKDGQVESILFQGENVYHALSLASHPQIGVSVKETGYEKIVCRYQGCTENLLHVSGAKRPFYAIKDCFVKLFAANFTPGDVLCLFLAPDGRLLSLVNQSRVKEYSCR